MIVNEYNIPNSIIDILNKSNVIFCDNIITNIINIKVQEEACKVEKYISITYIDQNGKFVTANGTTADFISKIEI